VTVLLTGFDAFGGLRMNPSQLIVEAVAVRKARNVHAAILPTAFREAGRMIRRLVREIGPRSIVCVGLAAGTAAVQLERTALNLNDSDIPDNTGDMPRGRTINPDGPAAYFSTLPLDLLAERLRAMGIPVRISNFAGAYVCNHVFYVAREEAERLAHRPSCGFIHVPLIQGTPDDVNGLSGFSLDMLVDAIACCVDTLSAP
jgi:pyroglutamyl-peptidase